MADHIEAVIDHVAVAVADWRTAEQRWRDRLGGGRSSAGDTAAFGARQLQFANGARLELLSPGSAADGFVSRFLGRHGSVVHHVTLKVPDLHEALDVLAAAGLEAVDVNDEHEHWKEAFLRPGQIGGLVVQIAQTPLTNADWARKTGFRQESPRTGAAQLLGPTLRHPDLGAAAGVWTALGASITTTDAGALRCAWPDSALDVLIDAGAPAGPVALRMCGSGDLPQDERYGAAVVEARP
jgi:catechol 2,3-dioxygenase-like lactoylglutathione lyase family enzyme